MMLHLDDPVAVLGLGVEHLVYELGAARADAGIVDPNDCTYVPTIVVGSTQEHASVGSTPLPNQHPTVRAVWGSSSSLSFERVHGNTTLGSLEETFSDLGMTAMIVSPIRCGGTALGLLCVDETTGRRRYSAKEHDRVDRFVRDYLAPILHEALMRRAQRSALTATELEVVELLAQGLSYQAIARRLGKSPRTVDNQLRSARSKTDARNAVELITWWQNQAV